MIIGWLRAMITYPNLYSFLPKPSPEILKFNFDAHFKDENTAIVSVIRDQFGNIIGIQCKLFQVRNVKETETRATTLITIGLINVLNPKAMLIEGNCKINI